MKWNWQQPDWPNFSYKSDLLAQLEQINCRVLRYEGSGVTKTGKQWAAVRAQDMDGNLYRATAWGSLSTCMSELCVGEVYKFVGTLNDSGISLSSRPEVVYE